MQAASRCDFGLPDQRLGVWSSALRPIGPTRALTLHFYQRPMSQAARCLIRGLRRSRQPRPRLAKEALILQILRSVPRGRFMRPNGARRLRRCCLVRRQQMPWLRAFAQTGGASWYLSSSRR